MVKNQLDLFPSSKSYGDSHQLTFRVPADQRFFKVPADQRKANPDAYEPYLFSFGLYHAVLPSATDHAILENSGSDSLSRDEGVGIVDAAAAAARLDDGAAAPYLKAYRDARSQFECSTDDGDNFKLLFAEALLSEDALSALVEWIQKHDAKFRKLYIQMPLVKLKALSASAFALRLALDSITIVAAALNPFKTNKALMAYPIARLSFSDAILLENQVPIFLHFLVIKALPELQASHISGDDSGSYDDQQQLLHQVLEWYRERASPFPNFTRAKPLHVNPYSTRPLLHYIYKYLTEAEADPAEQELEGTEYAPHISAETDPSEEELEGSKTPHTDQGPSRKASFARVCVQDRNNFGPLTLYSVSKPELDPLLPSASYLVKCGVKFRACDAGFQGIAISESWMAVELSIPRIAVSDNTVRSLHNLLAYEATTRYPMESFVISFVHFMDRLIDTQEDVQVLVDAGVIRNFLGSHKELASMWNKLCISVSCARTTENNRAIMARLEALAQKRWRKWWASYKEKNWKKQPWLIASLVGGHPSSAHFLADHLHHESFVLYHYERFVLARLKVAGWHG